MAEKRISVRLKEPTLSLLLERAGRAGDSAEGLVHRYVEEGLRMDAHPGIVFRPGPAGRRPALAAGPDVWEIIRVVLNSKQRGELAIEEAAAYFELPVSAIRVAVEYAEEYRKEIDRWLRMVDEEAERAEAAWRAAKAITGR